MFTFDMTEAACFTGHRPEKLNDLQQVQHIKNALMETIEMLICQHNVKYFISGMARGVDMWAARAVLKLKSRYPHIQLIAAVPCTDQYKRWPVADIVEWRAILDAADVVHYVSKEKYFNGCMQIRNKWMVDHALHVVAVYDGHSSGGTKNCYDYAQKKQRNIHLIPVVA